MKNAILLALVIVFAGCKKNDNDLEEREPTIEEKLKGKWQLVRAVDQVWQPVDSLVHSQENPVGPGDSVVFKTNTVVAYTDSQNGVDVEEYDIAFSNGGLLVVDEEIWLVRTLNDHNLVLEQVEYDSLSRRKDVLINYLER